MIVNNKNTFVIFLLKLTPVELYAFTRWSGCLQFTHLNFTGAARAWRNIWVCKELVSNKVYEIILCVVLRLGQVLCWLLPRSVNVVCCSHSINVVCLVFYKESMHFCIVFFSKIQKYLISQSCIGVVSSI